MNELAIGACDRVRLLNDRLRQHRVGGEIVVTAGLQALGAYGVAAIAEAVARFDDFTADNDPYGEHDFGAVEVEGRWVFFKIDTFDRDLRCHSADPADPLVTRRVLTIMLAEEY